MSSRKAERKRSVFDRLGPSDYEKEKDKHIRKKSKDKDRSFSSKDERRGPSGRHTHQSIESPPNSDFNIKRNWSKNNRSRPEEDTPRTRKRSSSSQEKTSVNKRKTVDNGRETSHSRGKLSQPQDPALHSVVSKQPANSTRSREVESSPVRSGKQKSKTSSDSCKGSSGQPTSGQMSNNGDVVPPMSGVEEQSNEPSRQSDEPPTKKPRQSDEPSRQSDEPSRQSDEPSRQSDEPSRQSDELDSNTQRRQGDEQTSRKPRVAFQGRDTSTQRSKLLAGVKGCYSNHCNPKNVFVDIGCSRDLAGESMYREVLDMIREQSTPEYDAYKPSLALARELKLKRQMSDVFKLKNGPLTSVDDRRLRRKISSCASEASNTSSEFKGLKFNKDLYSKSVELLRQAQSRLSSNGTVSKRIPTETSV